MPRVTFGPAGRRHCAAAATASRTFVASGSWASSSRRYRYWSTRARWAGVVRATVVALHLPSLRRQERGRPAHLLGRQRRRHHEVGDDLSAEAPAEVRDVQPDLLGGTAKRARDLRLAGVDALDGP